MHKAEQLRRGCTVLFHSQADHVYNRSTATGIADVVTSTFHSPCLLTHVDLGKSPFLSLRKQLHKELSLYLLSSSFVLS